MTRLELSFLGPFEAFLSQERITAFKSNKVRALLAYLAVEAHTPHRRESLAELLWPGWPAKSAMDNLRFSLADLRKQIGDRVAQPPFLLVSRERIQFNREAEVWVDVAEFEAGIRDQGLATGDQRSGSSDQRSNILPSQSKINNLQSAIQLYRGPFLEGFTLADSPAFEQWVLQTREQLSRRMLKALSTLVDHHLEQGEYEQALPYAYRGLDLEPWREEPHQQLMRVLALSGERSAALAQFEKCRQVLADELGVEPGDETVTLYEQIRDGKLEVKDQGRHREAFPPPAVQPGPKHNLPAQVTHFFGREGEIEQIKKRLAECRLVTLTGSGGVGKTRLSLQAAGEILEDYSDGVWYVELAPLSDPVLVPQQIAVTLGVREDPGRPILDTLTSFLHLRQALLILDNCEHLLEACARLADALLHACPRLKILASSREPLGVAGEAILRVPSLPFPDPDRPADLEKLEAYTAVSLFADRARLVMPDYQATSQNAASLARICQRLDGIPLAIELAATRMNILTTDQLVDRLEDAFRFLTRGSRTALPRQQTLRATIDWSYKLLDEKERLLLQRLAVFARGCTLEAAEAVCAGEGLEADEVLDRLASLVSKSMLIADRHPGQQVRYRLLETVRQYAREKLGEAGESARLFTRHRNYFLTFVETNGPKLYTRERPLWIRKLEAEHENLRLALEWSFNDLSDVEAWPRMVLTMEIFWGMRYYHEPYDWYKRGPAFFQSHAGISTLLYVNFLGHGSHSMALNDPQTALSWASQSVEISRRLGAEGKSTLFHTLLSLVWTCMWDLDDVEGALAPFAEAEALFQELVPNQYPLEECLGSMAWMITMKAGIMNKRGLYQDAKTYASESIRLHEQIDAYGEPTVWAHIFLGDALVNLGEYGQARDRYLEVLHLAEEIGDNRQPHILRKLGMVDFRQGNLERALAYCQQGLRLAFEIPDPNVIAYCLGLSACILAKQGAQDEAARFSGAAKALYERQRRVPYEDSSLDTILPGWRERPEMEAILKAYEEGWAMSMEQAVAYALSRVL